MKHPLSRCTPDSSLTGFTLLLALAGGSLASACSGYYPLGDVSPGQVGQNEGLADDSIAAVPTPATPLAAALPAPDFTLDADDQMGPGTLAFVGDLDGDGRDEMVEVSVNLATQIVSVHLRYGGPRPANDVEVFAFDHSGADLVLTGGYENALTVAAAGDIDGDGYADLLIRTTECNVQQEGTGAYLVYGGPERLQGTLPLPEVATHFVPAPRSVLETIEGVMCIGPGPLGRAGDLDGDGIDDLVITSAPLETTDGEWHTGTGEGVYVFYGRVQRFSGDVALASADAVFHFDLPISALPLGDVNGDGRADLMMVLDYPPQVGSYFVPGKSQRYSGTLDLPSHSTFLADAYENTVGWLWRPMDLDGDGLNDLLLESQDEALRLFYGHPGLFADGFDPSKADASLQRTDNTLLVYPVGDRDGDGKDDLLDQFNVPQGPVSLFDKEVAFSRGSSTRLSGSFSFPENEIAARSGGVRFPENPNRALDFAIPGGDLDGDGAADLFAVSNVYTAVGGSFYVDTPQIHVHYGVLGVRRTPPVH